MRKKLRRGQNEGRKDGDERGKVGKNMEWHPGPGTGVGEMNTDGKSRVFSLRTAASIQIFV